MVILCAGCNPFVSSSKTDVGFAPGVSKTTILGPFSSSWPFSSSTDYTYDPAKIQFSGGVCSLKTLDQTDDDNDSTSGFDGGTHTGTQWSGVNSWVELTNLSSTKALPNSGSTSSWTSMNGSALLLHLDGTIGLIADASSVTDSSTSALNFTANNVNTAGMAFAAGKVDQGIIFDGTDDHLEHAYSATLNPNQFTAMLWVMPTGGAGTIRVPMASRSTAGASFRGYSIAATAADIWQVSIGTGAGAWTTLTATNVVLNAWTHLALTYDGTTATFYVDGVDKGSANIAFLPNPDRPTRIGAGTTEGVASGFFTGSIDEASIFNRALSADEINHIHSWQLSTYSGFYDSRVMDAGGTVAWSTLGWTPQHPTLKELPNGGATEVAYSTGNIDMTGNVLLTHFDESAWTGVLSEVVDSSGAANHGRAFGTATTTLAGKFNRAGDFNGSSKYVRFLNSPGLTNTATVSMWLKARTTQTAALNYPIGIGTTNSFSIFVGGTYADASVRSRSIGLFAGGNVSCAVANSFTHANDSNVWRHIVVTYDKDAATRTHIYKDGVELTMFSQNVTGVIAAQDIIHIGIRPDLLLPFDGLIDEVAIWTRTLSPAEVYNLYRRGSVRLKFQVRTCATAACTGQSFVGPGGIIGTFFSELTSPTLGLPTALNISAAVANNQYFQYRAYMETDVSTDTPSLKNIAVGPSYYDSGNPTVVNNTPISYTSLSQFTETLGAGNVGTVKFQISKDGTNWYYHNGVTWSAASGFAQANTAAQIDTNIAIFSSVVGPGNFYFKAFLNSSSGTQAVELDNVSIQGIR